MTFLSSALRTVFRSTKRLSLCAGLMAVSACGAVVAPKASNNEAFAVAKYPPGGEIITVDGVEVHAVRMGSKHNPTVVMIHGASGNTRDFTFSFAGRMARDYHVIVMDRPGFGHTGRLNPELSRAYTTQAESLTEQAALLAKAARQLGAKKPIVVGHSYGGAVGLAWALNEPLSGLVTLGGVSHPWEGGLGLLHNVNGSALGGGAFVPWLTAFVPASYVEGIIESIFTPDPVPEGYADYVGSNLSIRRESLRANSRQLRRLKSDIEAQVADYGTISVPVHIVHGTQDKSVPIEIHAERAIKDIPTAKITRLEGVGHMPHHANPEAAAKAIEDVARRAGLK